MKKAWKTKWIAALRGGDYSQGRGKLRTEGSKVSREKFCCLGVLCDIVDANKWSMHGGMYYHSGNIWLPGVDMRERTGLTAVEALTLSAMNDDDKLSFKQIADWIEANL